nr:hypothetical protein [Tanacetum cinerariifolium]
DLYNARLEKDSYVAEMIREDRWKGANDWTESMSFLSKTAVPVITSGKKDKIIWLGKNESPIEFTMRNVYNDLRDHNEEVKWGKLVWFSQCIPKHSFILWMTVQERLMNHDRMRKWGCYDTMSMVACPINNHSWNDIVGILADKPCLNSIWSIIRRLCLGAAIYFIWQERNFRIFRDQKREWSTVWQLTYDTIKARLMGLTVKKSKAVDDAAAM